MMDLASLRKSREFLTTSDLKKEFEEELEMIQSIYPDKLELYQEGETYTLTMLLEPQTGCDNHRNKLSLKLSLSFSQNYTLKREPPEITISQARGLSEETISYMHTSICSFAEENEGIPMLYQLLVLGEDLIAEYDRPTVECAICLEHFEDDDFMRTDCYHFFHINCICKWYINYKESMIEDGNKDSAFCCPICKTPVLLQTLQKECGFKCPFS